MLCLPLLPRLTQMHTSSDSLEEVQELDIKSSHLGTLQGFSCIHGTGATHSTSLEPFVCH